MPENDSPTDDVFADLYSRLPDPRGAQPEPRGEASPSESTPPPSRRAAREARRAQTGETPAQAPAAAAPEARPDGAEPRAAAPRAAEPREAAPRAAESRTADPREAAPPLAAPRTAAPRAEAPDEAAPIAAPRQAPRATAPRTPAWEAAARTAAPRQASTSRGREQRPEPRSAAADTERVSEVSREPVLAGAGAYAGARGAATVDSPRSAPAGSLEDLFTGNTSTEQIGWTPAPAPRRRRRVGGWIALIVSVVVVGALVLVGVNLWNTYGDRVQGFFGASEPYDFEPGMATGEARVTIVSGDTGQSLSPKLFDAGVTKTANSLYQYMIDENVGFTFQPGVYRLQQQMTSQAVLTALQDPASRLDNSVQLREGLTVAQSLQVISEQLGMPQADLDAAVADPAAYGVPADSLEGWLFPATYDFDEGVSATDVISRMVQRTIQSLDANGVPADDRQQILTVAAIIEREARYPDDFYKVSRVIENRLDPSNQETFGKLEMDSTVQYGAGEMGSGSVSTSTEARNADNPWNTYIYAGLPKGPIANPGDRAIDAAMHPADGPWLYFVTVNLATGETVFTNTYSEHQKAIEQWQAWCRENPDGGC